MKLKGTHNRLAERHLARTRTETSLEPAAGRWTCNIDVRVTGSRHAPPSFSTIRSSEVMQDGVEWRDEINMQVPKGIRLVVSAEMNLNGDDNRMEL